MRPLGLNKRERRLSQRIPARQPHNLRCRIGRRKHRGADAETGHGELLCCGLYRPLACAASFGQSKREFHSHRHGLHAIENCAAQCEADAAIFAGGMLLLSVLIGVVESVMARLRLRQVPNLLVAACLLSAFGIILLAR